MTTKSIRMVIALAAVSSAACGRDAAPARQASSPPGSTASAADGLPTVYGNPRQRLTPEEMERARTDTAWRRTVQFDTTPGTGPAGSAEKWAAISPTAVNGGAPGLPLREGSEGPSVLRVQIALDRALFSPGVMDGRWGQNTAEAVYWLQAREGLKRSGRVDAATYQRLVRLAGSPSEWVTNHTLTEDDVAGPFVKIPDDIYEHAKLDCSCYESLHEKLAERFHSTPGLLGQLNPRVDLDAVKAGQALRVPNVRPESAGSGAKVATLEISDAGHYVHALDASGRLLYHFPSTLGASYSPSPQGKFSVTGVHWDPKWYYQPALLTGVPDWKEPATVPPGPNNAVGIVWMQLSKPHYGIHGTSAPETIGYATSHGCVRLTNWDARFLGKRVDPGVDVHFRDVHPGGQAN